MTIEETQLLLYRVKTAYPSSSTYSEKNLKAMATLWYQMFASDNVAVVLEAVNRHIATSKWPPTIAEVKANIVDIQRPDLLAPDQAWLAVSRLLNKIGQTNYGDLHQQLPSLVADAVEAIGWDSLWEMHRGVYGNSRPGLDRFTFIEQYSPMFEREHRRAMYQTPVDTAAPSS